MDGMRPFSERSLGAWLVTQFNESLSCGFYLGLLLCHFVVVGILDLVLYLISPWEHRWCLREVLCKWRHFKVGYRYGHPTCWSMKSNCGSGPGKNCKIVVLRYCVKCSVGHTNSTCAICLRHNADDRGKIRNRTTNPQNEDWHLCDCGGLSTVCGWSNPYFGSLFGLVWPDIDISTHGRCYEWKTVGSEKLILQSGDMFKWHPWIDTIH